jgi:Tfp pilus assembly protein PilZ
VADNRQHPRKIIRVPVAFQLEGAEEIVEAECTDVSLGGMFVETDAPGPYGAALVVYIQLPDMEQDAALTGTIRWVKKGVGMGVQFGVMGARETHGIIELVRRS